MASKNRERKAINAVACPACGSPRGELCRRPLHRTERTDAGVPVIEYVPQTQYGRPMICAERRTAWQMVRDGEIREEKN